MDSLNLTSIRNTDEENPLVEKKKKHKQRKKRRQKQITRKASSSARTRQNVGPFDRCCAIISTAMLVVFLPFMLFKIDTLKTQLAAVAGGEIAGGDIKDCVPDVDDHHVHSEARHDTTKLLVQPCPFHTV